MDFRNDTLTGGAVTGGSDGCINFNDPTNNGLSECVQTLGLPALYSTYCDVVSLADFFVIISEAVMARTHHSYNPDVMFASGAVSTNFRNNFRFGRETADTCPEAVDLVPKADDGCGGIKDAFHDHIFVKETTGMTWRYVSALSAVHGLGRAKLENNGFDGFFSDADNVGKFSNDYFSQVLANGWSPERNVGGNPNKVQWQRADQGKNDAHKQIMLDSDLCLAYQNNIRCGARD